MLVDKVTLNDLSIFHSDEEQSVFHHLNFTNTNGGRAYLKHLLANPLLSIESIVDTQKTIGHLQTVAEPEVVPTVVVASTLIFLDSEIERVQPVVVLVIKVNLTSIEPGLFNT